MTPLATLLAAPLSLVLDVMPTPVPEPLPTPTKLALVVGAVLLSAGAVLLVLRARRRR